MSVPNTFIKSNTLRSLISIFLKLLKYLTLVIWALLMLVPLIAVFFGAFKTSTEFNSTSALTMPETFKNFENFIVVFQKSKLLQGFLNTFILIIFSVFGSILLGSMVAYIISRLDFKCKKLLLGVYLFISMAPLELSQISTFKIINFLGLYNTKIAAILLYISVDALMIYIYLQALSKIPRDFDKAAILEGAGYFTIYRKIIFPLLKPATATIALLKTIAIYKDFYIPFLYMPGENMKTVSTALFSFIGPENTQWHLISAAIVISIIPMIILFLFLQKYIFKGLTAGGIR